jgi:pilus assembly protein CpaC
MTIMKTHTHHFSAKGLGAPKRVSAKAAAWILIVAVLNPAVVRAQVAVSATSAAAAAAPAAPAAPAAGVDAEASAVRLVTGRSTVLDVGTTITRVSLTSAEIADALVTSSTQLLIHAKAPGTISMFVWERSGAVRRFEVIVARDVAKLADQVKQLFPGEAVSVSSNGRDVVLSGAVTKKEIADQLINLSLSFVDKKEEVVSLLRVQNAPTNQVLLRVRFAEVSRTALTELGMSLFTSATGIENTLGRVTTQQFSGGPGFEDLAWSKNSSDFGAPVASSEGKITFSDFLNLFVLSQRYDLGVLIRALSARGLFQSLAEPNLVAESGKEASFLAGGEFPIPIVQPGGGNAITIQFKEFGVRLNFTPIVQGDRIRLKVRPEVSSLDFGNGIALNGFRVPALVSRRTETELELRDGQTFAIAGLLNNSLTSTMQKIPGIGDIPILGYLFRSKAANKNRTELVVMITPQILPEGSFGVTRELPRLQEPYLPALPDNRSLANPPAPFPQPGAPAGNASTVPVAPFDSAQGKPAPAAIDSAQAVPSGSRGTTGSAAPAAAAVMSAPAAPAPVVSSAPVMPPTPTAAERKAAEKAAAAERKEAEKRAAAEAKAAKARAEEERKVAERQRKAAQEQAKRDAEEARKKAEADRKAAEEARRKEEAEKKRQSAVEDAAAKVRAAEAAYEAEVARSNRQ